MQLTSCQAKDCEEYLLLYGPRDCFWCDQKDCSETSDLVEEAKILLCVPGHLQHNGSSSRYQQDDDE